MEAMTERERFLACMEYKPVDRVPNHEVGVWEQTKDRWETEGMVREDYNWDWFTGSDQFGMDAREFIPVHYGMWPYFEEETLEETDRYLILRNSIGVVTKALKEGTSHGMRNSMDTFLEFPVKNRDDFRAIKKHFNPTHRGRYPPEWRKIGLPRWKNRDTVLILGTNASTLGFYWRAREWMGTEAASYAWYDQPELMHEMMEFIADFTIEVSRPILEAGACPDYMFINEDMAGKGGPLISPKTYNKFILPHMRRMVDFFKQNGVRYVVVDTDGDTDALIPSLMQAGVDGIWPVERAAGMDPLVLRKKYGRDLRLWGGIDKIEISKGRAAIDAHLATLAPLVEEGGFIPTVDHLVSPEISWQDFLYFMERKQALLAGNL
jgi:uroporphyrinogen decarboxylase